jgi:hypothetical protein
MYETYRMLGREHEADLEREARKQALARQAPKTASTWPLVVVVVVGLVLAAIVLGAMSALAS